MGREIAPDLNKPEYDLQVFSFLAWQQSSGHSACGLHVGVLQLRQLEALAEAMR